MPRRSKKLKKRTIPQNVKDAMIQNGCEFERFVGEDLCRIGVEFGDEAWKVYEQWAETKQDEPAVQAVFSPNTATIEKDLCPSDATFYPLILEVNSIIFHYGPLLFEHFLQAPASQPVIPGPLIVMPCDPVRFHHTKVALSGLMRRIQAPPASYPTLLGLRSGSYICHVQQIWGNAIVCIAVFKP